MRQYYKPSGQFNPLVFIYSLIVCCTVVPLLGYLYALGIHYIPFIYINFILSAGFGFGVAIALSFASSAGKNRNVFITYLLSAVTGLVSLYFHWGFWLSLTLEQDLSLFILEPSFMLETIPFINENGTWGFSSSTVSGWFLTLIWIIETLIIIVPSFLVVPGAARKPFCEQSNKWFEESESAPMPFIMDVPTFIKQLETGDDSFFKEFTIASDQGNHSIFTTYASDKNEYYISVTNQQAKIDDGKLEFDEDEFISYLSVKQEFIELLANVTHESKETISEED